MHNPSSHRTIYKKIPILTISQSDKKLLNSHRNKAILSPQSPATINNDDTESTLSTLSIISTQSKTCFNDNFENSTLTKSQSKPNLPTNANLIFIKKKIPIKKATHLFQSESPKQKQLTKINLEELILLESKLNEIVHKITIGDVIILSKACVDWWNFYFNSSLNGSVDNYFIDVYSKDVIMFYSSILFFTVMVIYDMCFHVDSLNEIYQSELNNLMALLQINFLIICDYISSKITIEYKRGNFWVEKLSQLLLEKEISNKIKNSRIEEIKLNNNVAYEKLVNVFNKITKDKKIEINKQLSKLVQASLYLHNNQSNNNPNIKLSKDFFNNFFINKVLIYQTNTNGSIISTAQTNNKNNLNNLTIPYITSKSLKPLTLVLDLDETLVNVKISKVNSNQGCLLFRPGLDEFLENLSQWYEIIIFTAATKDYADAILDEIDINGDLFSYRLYREHTTIIGNDYVKDISLIGRDLDKMIIVDNMAQNFKLQKENGILIHSFWGDDEYDVALIELEKILWNVAQERCDVRISLRKYKDDILKKVSSKLFWDTK